MLVVVEETDAGPAARAVRRIVELLTWATAEEAARKLSAPQS
jgi:hypothetical protein